MRRAISLLEVLVAIFVLSIGLLAVAVALVPGKWQLRQAMIADRATSCGQASLANMRIRDLLVPESWRATDGATLGQPRPVLPGTVYTDTTRGYPWGESYAIDCRYSAMLRKYAPGVQPADYTDFPYRPEAPGSPLLGQSWSRLHRITSTNGGGFNVSITRDIFSWSDDLVFATEARDDPPGQDYDEQVFDKIGSQPIVAQNTGHFTWLVTATPSPDPIWFVADTSDGPAAFSRYEGEWDIAVVVFYRRDHALPGLHTPGEPPPERQVRLEFLGIGMGGGDVRLHVFGDPADPSTWQPPEYLADVRKNEWILVTGMYFGQAHYEMLDSSTALWGQPIGVHRWYRVLAVTDIVDDGTAPPWIDVTLAGSDWHMGHCRDLDGDGSQNDAVASLFDGIVGVFTSAGPLR